MKVGDLVRLNPRRVRRRTDHGDEVGVVVETAYWDTAKIQRFKVAWLDGFWSWEPHIALKVVNESR